MLLARNLLSGLARAESLSNARTTLRAIYEKHVDAETWLEALGTIEGWTERSGRGYVVDSFWSAWDAVAGAYSYREAVERAIRYGHDTDTTACIAGGLAGIRWSVEGIPVEWRSKMRGQEIVKPLVAALVGEKAVLASTAPAGSQTSETHPIRVDWVDPAAVPASAGWTGHLGMTFLPGKKDQGSQRRHWRDLETDAERLAGHWKVDTFVLLVENDELAMTKTTGIAESMQRHGIELIRYPIGDVDVPKDRESLADLLANLEKRLRAGETVVIACRGGLGRTGTVVGCLLRDAGLGGPHAVELTRKSRDKTIETAEQKTFVLGWEGSR